MKQSEFDAKMKQASDSQLEEMLLTERKNLYGGRQEIARKQLNNPHVISVAKKNVARILTEMRAREIKAGKES